MAGFAGIAIEVLLDAVLDTLYLVPFLFVTYLFMEWLEHRTGERAQNAIRRAGKAGPIIGAVLGVVPQCGFSAAASTLYAGRVITLGTLFAVYLSTSDEMLPIFIAAQMPAGTIVAVLACKVAVGIVFGFLVDLALRARRARKAKAVEGRRSSQAAPGLLPEEEEGLRIHELCTRDHCDCSHGCATCEENPALAYAHHDDCADGCDHEHHEHDHSHDAGWAGIVKSAARHTVKVTLFVFIISLALNALLAVVGEEALGAALGDNSALAVAGAALVGLIPNCAASVAVAQLYVDGVLGAGAMMAGLLSAAGVGLLVLLRANRPEKQNALIVVTLVVISMICGWGIDALGVVF